MLSGCNEDVVLENLTQEQAVQVQAILQQHDLTSVKSGSLKSGYSISVPRTEVASALSVIKEYQLPRSADVQISQAFPDNSLLSSPGAEKTRIISLEEQRLEQSLNLIDQVVNVRVHISYPINDNDYMAAQQKSHVGVLISYKGDLEPATFIPEIKSLIKNSLDSVDYENISVVVFPFKDKVYGKAKTQMMNTTSLFLYCLIGLLTLLLVLICIYFASQHFNFLPVLNRKNEESSSEERGMNNEN